MKRLGIILFGLALVFGQPLAAQDYAPDLTHHQLFQYTFKGGSGVSADWNGINVGPYSAYVGHVNAFNNPTAPTFTLYCVDYAHTIWKGYQATAVASTLGTGDISATRLGVASYPEALTRYKAAAWLASQFAGAGQGHWSAIQTTIWAITATSSSPYWTMANMTGPGGMNWMDATEAAYNAGWAGMNFNDWHVLTAYDVRGDQLSLSSRQEILTQTQSVVPEPQTYVLLFSGLIFMVFFGRRRMKEMGYF